MARKKGTKNPKKQKKEQKRDRDKCLTSAEMGAK